MQQIARELPSLAMDPQMFFLAITNNIPMFTDALASARKEYEALTDAGKKATPVWKQVLSSLFSWQTAMAALITLSVVYGKEIGGWVKSLFGVKDAALSAAKAQEKVNESFRSSSSDVAEQVTLVRSLSERWKELGDNMADKKQFITENKKEFGKLGVEVGNVNDAENLLVDNTDVFIGGDDPQGRGGRSVQTGHGADGEGLEKAERDRGKAEERPDFLGQVQGQFLLFRVRISHLYPSGGRSHGRTAQRKCCLRPGRGAEGGRGYGQILYGPVPCKDKGMEGEA